MKNKIQLLVISIAFPLFIAAQSKFKNEEISLVKNDDVFGYEFLNKIVGQWNGPVTTSTSAGSFDVWYVDYRPVSASQVSHFSMLDSNTVNNMSFFVVKYKDKLIVALRTEGCFKDKCCVTYEVMDSVNDSKGYYRFSDFINGAKRACSEFVFKGDEMTMKVYTNKFNKANSVQLHSTFTAKLASRKNAIEAIKKFEYPQPIMVKDFSNEFKNMSESIFFSFENDPYKSENQPYVGSATINIKIDDQLKTAKTDELCILLSTEPFFEGIKYNKETLKYISKYVYLPLGTKSYTLKNVHPGKYYVYTYLDRDNDKKHKKGDYMSSNTTQTIIVPANGNAIVNSNIDFIIP